MICEFLFYDENGEKKEQFNYIDLKIQIRELIKHPFDREVLTAVLLDLRKDVAGNTRLELFRIYQELELHKDAYQKLRSWRWERVSKGIYELTQMQVRESYGHITGFINDKRPTIRKQAELATVSLNAEGINYFLDHTKYRISEWQQLKLLDVVLDKKDYRPPPFRLWLTSKNNHVVLFALRLIKNYNQNDASASLIELLRHNNNHIKKEVIFCIRDFNVTDAVPVLKTIFWKCTADVKMYLLEALSQLGTEEDIGFLEAIITNEVAFTVKGKAISALNTIRPEGVLPTQGILPKSDFEKPEAAIEENPPSLDILRSNDILPPTALETSDAKIPVNHRILDSMLPSAEENELEDVQNLEVCYETVAITIPSDVIHSREIIASELLFLPIVTDEISEFSDVPTKTSTNKEDAYKPIADIMVNLEEVGSLPLEKELVFDFLPIVVALTEEDKTVPLNELFVVYEDVVIRSNSSGLDRIEKEVLPKDLTVIYEEVKSCIMSIEVFESNENKMDGERSDQNTQYQQPEVIFSDAIAPEALADFPVSYVLVTVKTEIKNKEMNLEIDWSDAFGPKKEIPVPKKSKTNDSNKKPSTLEKAHIIPKPMFYTDELLNTILLLEDIEEWGDQREVPYLKILLEQENNAQVKERISTLISFFSRTEKAIHYFKIPTNASHQSMFHILIEGRDIEMQLMLLKEIAEVGDEKEIPLLKDLVVSDSKVIREAASQTLKQLNAKLLGTTEQKAPAETKPFAWEQNKILEKTENEMFAIAFDVAPTVDKTIAVKDSKRDNTYGSTMFDHLCATSSKLYEKE